MRPDFKTSLVRYPYYEGAGGAFFAHVFDILFGIRSLPIVEIGDLPTICRSNVGNSKTYQLSDNNVASFLPKGVRIRRLLVGIRAIGIADYALYTRQI